MTRAPGLLIAALLALPASPALAQEAICRQISWSVGHEIDLFADGFLPSVQSSLALPKEGVFTLLLKSASDVIYPVAPDRGRDSGYGGIVTIESIPAGRYQVLLSEEAWVDAVQHYRRLPVEGFSRAETCAGVRQSVQFVVAGEPMTLQVSGALVPKLNIAIARMWEFERRGKR